MSTVIGKVARVAALLASGMLVSGAAVAKDKVNICHLTGKGTVKVISVSLKAVAAHIAHGDVMPGTTMPDGVPYLGLYGSTVQPMLYVGADCTTTEAVEVTSPFMGFAGTGWAGWSCVEPGYPKVLGGGVLPEGASVGVQGPAKPGVTVGGSTYPVFPHHTFIPPEEGWVAQAAGTPLPTNIVVLCGP